MNKSDKLAKYRTGKKWPRTVKAAIGDGVRHGPENKVPFNTRIAQKCVDAIRAKAQARAIPMAQAVERAFLAW